VQSFCLTLLHEVDVPSFCLAPGVQSFCLTLLHELDVSSFCLASGAPGGRLRRPAGYAGRAAAPRARRALAAAGTRVPAGRGQPATRTLIFIHE